MLPSPGLPRYVLSLALPENAKINYIQQRVGDCRFERVEYG